MPSIGTSKVGDLVSQITLAIFRQEGHDAEYPNPGSLRDCPWFPGSYQKRWYDKVGGTLPVEFVEGFWVPRSRAEGEAGAIHVVALRVAEAQSLRELIYAWAPPTENDSAAYLADVMSWTGIQNADAPLYDLA